MIPRRYLPYRVAEGRTGRAAKARHGRAVRGRGSGAKPREGRPGTLGEPAFSPWRVWLRGTRTQPRSGDRSAVAGSAKANLVRPATEVVSAGMDGVTAADDEQERVSHRADRWHRIRSGRYGAPPRRRRWIPKANGRMRPLGIPTLEDKLVQRAILMLREPIYEQKFLPCSTGGSGTAW